MKDPAPAHPHNLNSNGGGGSSKRTLFGRWEPPAGKKMPSHETTYDNMMSCQPYEREGQKQRENNSNNKDDQKQRKEISVSRCPKSNSSIRQPKTNKKNIISPDETNTSILPMEADVPKLDPDNPDHARRIRQRRRQVLFGKNTAGYEEYIKKVPKHKRKFKNLEHPQTPDHLADIPTKRWQGQMNAWRRALHKFDPPDLASRQSEASNKAITLAPRPCATEQDKVQEEIAQAKASGLQVAFDSMIVGKEAGLFSLKVATEDDGVAEDRNEEQNDFSKVGDELFDEEAAYQTCMNDSGFLEQGCESDSDDDLL